MTTRDWALAYAQLRWPVIPLVPGGKRPLYRGWQRDATTDPDLISRYWRHEPGPNVGVVCGEVFDAFDIEAAHLPAVRAWIETDGHRLPVTPVARTGGGGIHLLVRPTGLQRGRDLHHGAAHIGELKSAGGFIVVCPSVTVGPYRWLRSPIDQPLAEAPGWLRELLIKPTTEGRPPTGGGRRQLGNGRGLEALAEAIAHAGSGRRNKVLYWAMRRAQEEGIAAAIAATALGRSARSAGLSEREVRATIRSAYEAAQR